MDSCNQDINPPVRGRENDAVDAGPVQRSRKAEGHGDGRPICKSAQSAVHISGLASEQLREHADAFNKCE